MGEVSGGRTGSLLDRLKRLDGKSHVRREDPVPLRNGLGCLDQQREWVAAPVPNRPSLRKPLDTERSFVPSLLRSDQLLAQGASVD